MVQCLSVCPFVPVNADGPIAADPVLQSCCCGPCGQKILINCCTGDAQQQQHVAGKCKQCHAVSIHRKLNTDLFMKNEIIKIINFQASLKITCHCQAQSNIQSIHSQLRKYNVKVLVLMLLWLLCRCLANSSHGTRIIQSTIL